MAEQKGLQEGFLTALAEPLAEAAANIERHRRATRTSRAPAAARYGAGATHHGQPGLGA